MSENTDVSEYGDELAKFSSTKRQRMLRHLLQAALGSIPWIGGLMAAIASFKAGEGQAETDSLQSQWMEEHRRKIEELAGVLNSMSERFETFGQQVENRIESEDYLAIVRRGFKEWDDAATAQKKSLMVQLITNAGLSDLCSDDVIRLFQDWINQYHEIHFAVIGAIYNNPGWGRGRIWQQIRGGRPREDSAEADLFKLLVRDLSTGGIIRQHRETNYYGEFVKKKPSKQPAGVHKSAFDDEDPYELTELGKQFVHYTMEELVPRLSTDGSPSE